MSTGVAHALGMGEIEVNTALNEPLDAKIKLFSATPAELNKLSVQLASQEAYQRLGMERHSILRELNFELVSSGKDAPYIKVTTTNAVKEPFLDFLINVNWSSGQMMREYTLLLDPPVFEKDEQVGRVSAAATQPARVVRDDQGAATASMQPRVAPPGSYGPTRRTDTLWGIASDMRPDSSVSIPQMMIALLKENPEAFENNNINNLKAGYILRSPDMDVIRQISAAAAAAESNRQYQDWMGSKGQVAATGRQQRVASDGAATTDAAGRPVPTATKGQKSTEARLQLLSPDEDGKARVGVGSGTSGEATEALRRELAVAMETAEATRQENSDLRARLEELEKQLQSVQKLMTLQDDTMSSLQADAQRKEQEQAAAMEPAPVEAEAEAPAPAPKPVKPAPKPVVTPEPVETSLLDDLMANPMYLGAAVGGVVLILVLVMAKIRRRRADEDDEEFGVLRSLAENIEAKGEKEKGDDRDVSTAAVTAAAATAAAAATEAAEEESPLGDIGGGIGEIHAEESEIDPIAEADVYLAYRRYEQAEALLKEAINVDPTRHELKLKLLEIYSATKDENSFEAVAESLYAGLGGGQEEVWARAVEMGREILPNHPLFGGGGTGGVTAGDPAEASGEDFVADEISETGIEDFTAGEEFALPDDVISDEELANSLNLPDLSDFPGGEETSAVSDDIESLGGLDLDTEETVANTGDDLGADLSLGDLELEDADLQMEADESVLGLAESSENSPEEVAALTDDQADVLSMSDESETTNDMLELDDISTDETAEAAAEDLVVDPLADLSDLGEMDFSNMSDSEGETNDDVFGAGDDMVGTKLDLAKAYIDMGDQDGARSILGEVVEEGDEDQRQEAEQLMRQIS